MTIKLENKSRYLEKKGKTDWWEWTAFIEADDPQELEEIDYIEYRLHPSFKNPIVWVRKRENGFPLVRKGWGTFLLSAKVNFKDKTKSGIILNHHLRFIRLFRE